MVRQSGCQIHVQKEVPNGCEERPVNITGTSSQSMMARPSLPPSLSLCASLCVCVCERCV